MSATLAHSSFVDHRRRQIVLVGLFDALDKAGIRAAPPTTLHAAWYLANVLSPVWGLDPFDAAVLKTQGQPYFPLIRRDIDCLVGMGVVRVAGLSRNDESGAFAALFSLNRALAQPILEAMESIQEERLMLEFLAEVIQSLNRLPSKNQPLGVSADATYSDPHIDTGNVVDLGEWRDPSTATNTARVLDRIEKLAQRSLLPAERMDIYMDHLGRRASNG